MPSKKDILECDKIIYTIGSYGNYQYCDTYNELEKIVNENQNICEYISNKVPVNLYFDVDAEADSAEADSAEADSAEADSVVETIDDAVKKRFPYKVKRILLSSHSESKISYHIIYRIVDSNGKPILFDNVTSVKNLCIELCLDKIIDMSVYRDGLFRTYNSYKYNEKEKRIFIKDSRSDDFLFKESFVCYAINNAIIVNIPELLVEKPKGKIFKDDREKILLNSFIMKAYKRNIYNIYNKGTYYIIRLTDTLCPFIGSRHKSNGQYIVFTDKNCFMKCLDEVCKDKIHNKLTTCKYSKELKELYKGSGNNISISTKSLTEEQLNNVKTFVLDNYPIHLSDIESLTEIDGILVKTNIVKCMFCEEQTHEQYIMINKTCSKWLCKECPGKEKFKIYVDAYPKEIQNIFIDVEEGEKEFVCTVKGKIDPGVKEGKYNKEERRFEANGTNKCIFGIHDKKIDTTHYLDNTGLYTRFSGGGIYTTPINKEDNPKANAVIQAHSKDFLNKLNIPNNFFNDSKLKDLYELLAYCCTERIIGLIFAHIENRVLFYDKEDELYIYIDNHWHVDKDEKISSDILHDKMFETLMSLQKRLISELPLIGEANEELIKKESNRIEKIIVNILKTVGNRNILKNAIKTSFTHFINYKSNLFDNDQTRIPFLNGVYDLYENKFIQHDKNHYITTLIGYEYNPTIDNEEVMKFLTSILPNKGILDYVLKCCSDVLNGNKPNNNFLILTGTGGNGKTLFLTLLEKTFDCLGTTLNAVTLTRKETDPNSATPALVKLKNKRFCSISESEKDGTFNTTLLKRLTGNDTIVARALYKAEQEYTIRAKFFLACNKKPTVDAADQALWRRLKVIPFDEHFTEKPILENDHLIDTTLMDKIEKDITWKQTMMNILIQYYSKNIKTPTEVILSTTEYKDENNEFEKWLDDNIILDKESYIELKDIIKEFTQEDKPLHTKESALYKGKIIDYIKKKYPKHDYEYKRRRMGEIHFYGWSGIKIKKF